jgi:hypothetical protein
VVIFLTRSRYKQKKISNKLFTFPQCGRTKAKGAVARLDEALALGLTSVSEWAAEWQSLCPWPWPLALELEWPWRLVSAWAFRRLRAPGSQPSLATPS